MLENTEGEVREQLGASNVRIPDLPQYILTKLGLNKDNLLTTADVLDVKSYLLFTYLFLIYLKCWKMICIFSQFDIGFAD